VLCRDQRGKGRPIRCGDFIRSLGFGSRCIGLGLLLVGGHEDSMNRGMGFCVRWRWSGDDDVYHMARSSDWSGKHVEVSAMDDGTKCMEIGTVIHRAGREVSYMNKMPLTTSLLH